MKSYKHVFFLFLLIFSFSNDTFSQTLSEDAVGTWVFNYEKSVSLMDENAKKHFHKMDDVHKEKVKRAYVGRKIILENNGDFIQELADGRKVYATWEFFSGNDGNRIKVSDSRGGIRWFRIARLNKNVLVIVPIKSEDTRANMLLSKWYLNKIED